MSSQSSLDRLKAVQVNRKESLWVIVGAVAGLVLGLLIGWVWWPVDWQGGAPNTLSQAAQIDYVSTVADAYAAYGTPEALALAQQRLAAFGDALPALFDAALTTYSEQPAGGQQVANLAALASALGVTVTALPTTAPPTAAVGAPAATTTAASTAADEGGWNWFGILLGLVVLAIGSYFGWVLFKRLRTSSRPAPAVGPLTESAPVPPPITPYGGAAPDRSTPPPAYAAAQAAATKVPPVQPPATAAAPPFEPEDVTYPTATPPRSSQSFAPSVAVQPGIVQPGTVQPVSVQPVAPDAFMDDAEEVTEAAEPSGQNAGVASGQRPGAATMGWVAGAGRLDRYPIVDRLTTQFIAGNENYHITQNITAPDGAYLGEFGVGVSDRYGMLNNDPEQVVAIEVYIFDKSDEKHLVNVSRVLMSEYADTHLRKHFEREKDKLGPIVAQPKTTLQLEARHFVLLCTITAVRYTDEGIFARLDLDLELKKKV
jgi:hypothetical protein